MSVEDLPTLNALLNTLAALLLLGGWIAIRAKRAETHKRFMLGALFVSGAFLSSYLYYHFNVPGLTRYEGEGVARFVYFAILGTHTPLATLMVPFIGAALWFAYKGQFSRHVKVVKWLWPVWMYVSVTGVLIYLMLYVW